MYLECHGSGSPTVILEAGYRNDGDIWTTDVAHPPPVLPGTTRFTRVCAYDRPATILDPTHFSRSDPVPMPRTARDVVTDLHALLRSAHVPGPYVLVGHSLGGLFIRLYASTYRHEVVGVVLVDAFAEVIPKLMGPQWPAYRTLLTEPVPGLNYPDLETIDFDTSCKQLLEAKPLRRMPLVVLSHGRPFELPPNLPSGFSPQALERAWTAAQDYLAGLMPHTPHIIATQSSHYIQIEQPQLVIGAVKHVVNAAQKKEDEDA